MATIPTVVVGVRDWFATAFAEAVIDQPVRLDASGDWLFRIRSPVPHVVYELVLTEEAVDDHPTPDDMRHLLERAKVVAQLRKHAGRRLRLDQFGRLREVGNRIE